MHLCWWVKDPGLLVGDHGLRELVPDGGVHEPFCHASTCPMHLHGSLKSMYSPSLPYMPRACFVGWFSSSIWNFSFAMLSNSLARWRATWRGGKGIIVTVFWAEI